MVDEVADLDVSGADAFARAINTLAKEHQCLIVSHDETLKGGFQNTLVVNKGRDGSYIKAARVSKKEGVAA